MAIQWAKCWACEVCGFLWQKTGDTPPKQCASQVCRSRRWNASATPGKQSPAPAPLSPSQPSPVTRSPRRIIGRPPQLAAAAQMQPLPSAPVQQPNLRVRSDESAVVPALRPSAPPALARLADALATSRKVGEKCAHGFANWMLCATCNPRSR